MKWWRWWRVAAGGGTTLLPSSMKSLGLRVFFTRCRQRQNPRGEKEKRPSGFEAVCGSPFSWSWRCSRLPVPVAASLEGHHKAAPPPPQLLLLLGYCRGQSIATANKARLPLKSAQCQLSQSERVKYGHWKRHRAATGLIFHLMFACNMVQY